MIVLISLILPIAFLGIYTYTFSQIKFLLFFAFFFVYLLKNKNSLTVKKYFFVPIILIILSLFSFQNYYSETIYYIYLTVIPFLFVFLFDPEETKFEKLGFFLSISVFIISLFGFLNFYGYTAIFSENKLAFTRGSLRTLIGNTNYTSNFLALSLPIILYKYFRSNKKITSLWYWGCGVLSATVITWCQTRAVYLGISISLFVFFFFFLISGQKIKKIKTVLLLIAFCVVFLLFIAPPGLPDEIPSPFESAFTRTVSVISEETSKSTSYQRRLEWRTALNMFVVSPIIGHGWGSYKLLSPDYQIKITNSDPEYYGYYQKDYEAHSDWLQILSEGGLVGFTVFTIFVLMVLYFGLKHIFNNKKDFFYISIFCGFLVLLFHSFVEFPLHMQPSLAFFCLFACYLLKDLPTKKVNFKVSTIIILLLIPSVFISLKFEIGDIFGAVSNNNLKVIQKSLQTYDSEMEIEEKFIDPEKLSYYNQLFSQKLFKLNIDTISYSLNALDMNGNNTFYIYFLTSALYYLQLFEEQDIYNVLGVFYPYPEIKSVKKFAEELRVPPKEIIKVPKDLNNKILITLYKVICNISADEVNMPLDPSAFSRIANVSKNGIKIMKNEGLSDQEVKVWKEWMKYSYRLALKMRGRDSSDWYCIDIEFLNALADIEGITKEFEDEFIFRLQHREKLIEYGIDDDLPALWYDFYDQNISRLSSEQRELAKGLMLKIQRMVNENQK